MSSSWCEGVSFIIVGIIVGILRALIDNPIPWDLQPKVDPKCGVVVRLNKGSEGIAETIRLVLPDRVSTRGQAVQKLM